MMGIPFIYPKSRKPGRYLVCLGEIYKKCTKCQTFVELETGFSTSKLTADGKTPNCLGCRRKKYQCPIKRKEWYIKNKNKKSDYYQKNKKHIHETRKKFINSSPINILQNRYRKGIRKQRINRVKNGRSLEVLGCSYQEFYEYLIKTFEMNYKIKYDEKYWPDLHIDHIIPKNIAKTEEDVLKLNHYTNFQLLHKTHNMEKKTNMNYVVPEYPKDVE